MAEGTKRELAPRHEVRRDAMRMFQLKLIPLFGSIPEDMSSEFC